MKLVECGIKSLSTSVANKLVLNFSAQAKPDEFRKLMKALASVTTELFTEPALLNVVKEEITLPD